MKDRTNIVLEIDGEKYRLYKENPSPCEYCALYLPCRLKHLFRAPCQALGGNWSHFENDAQIE